jgi:hypothetical protein
MKVEFYCDVPEYAYHGMALCAWTHIPGYAVSNGYKRLKFTVDMPIKEYDQFLAQVVPTEQHNEQP